MTYYLHADRKMYHLFFAYVLTLINFIKSFCNSVISFCNFSFTFQMNDQKVLLKMWYLEGDYMNFFCWSVFSYLMGRGGRGAGESEII